MRTRHPILAQPVSTGRLYAKYLQQIINNAPIPRTGTFTCLGVELDGKLNWEKHIDSICQKVSAGIGIMRRIKPYVPSKTLQDIYNGLVMPYFDYCSPLWDTCGKWLQDKLQKYQNRAARVISGAGYETRSTDVLESLGWETLEKRRLRNKAVLMYKIFNDHSAPNLKQLFNKRNEAQTSYNLRNNQTDITLPNPKTEYLKRTLGYNGAKLWNSLPHPLKVAASISSFKNLIADLEMNCT